MNTRVIIATDDISFINTINGKIKNKYNITIIDNQVGFLDELSAKSFNILLIDVTSVKKDPKDTVKTIKKIYPNLEIIIISGKASVEEAVELMRNGASDYIIKPFSMEHLMIVFEKCLENIKLKEDNVKLKEINENLINIVKKRHGFGKMIGQNHKMVSVYEIIDNLKYVDSTVLITGETGTGKELVAKSIHYNSLRSNKPFIAVNCGALSETLLESEFFGHEKGSFTGAIRRKIGRFEQADKGTIFLDEIGDISLLLQLKLLRVLQEREVERVGSEKSIKIDVRVIAATNKNLEKLIFEGLFRDDLYYRLNVIPIHMPPLRERADDLPLLIKRFLSIYREKLNKDVRSISQEAINALMRYHWPGNVRELENIIERAIAMAGGKHIERIEIPGERRMSGERRIYGAYRLGEINVDLPLKDIKDNVFEQVEKEYLKKILTVTNGKLKLVSEKAKIDTKTLYTKMKKYSLNKNDFKKTINIVK